MRIEFICQVTEYSLKIIKCAVGVGNNRDFTALVEEKIGSGIDEKSLTEKIKQALKKMGYSNNRLIVSLPRHNVTCRYLKVPTQVPEEIERMVVLQAPRYLPYSGNELITGYQIDSVDKDGYANVGIVIVHKDIIGRYLNIFNALSIKNFTITLSSLGICNLYEYIVLLENFSLKQRKGGAPEKGPVMVIDIDLPVIEIVIVNSGKMLFSRSFKTNYQKDNWQNYFLEEINKTKEVFLKESPGLKLNEAAIVNSLKNHDDFVNVLSSQTNLSIKAFSYKDKIHLSKEFKESILLSGASFASLIGLGLKEISESLNLIPQDLKNIIRKNSVRKGRLKILGYILIIISIFVMGLIKHLDNKVEYLEKIKIELSKISKEAKPLEEIAKRLNILESQDFKKITVDIIYEIHNLIPDNMSLSSYVYEDGKQVTLRGYSSDLNSVFIFVSSLEKSPVLRGFNVKVRYATEKNIKVFGAVEFEIVCLPK